MRTIFITFVTIFLFSTNAISQCFQSGQSIDPGYIVDKTGIEELDSILFSEIESLENFYSVNIEFFYLIENDSKKNAFYTPSCENSECDGSVFLGVHLLKNSFSKVNGLDYVRGVIAHEFGHCLQNLISWKENWKRPELHADFLAGYYLGSKYEYSDIELQNFYSDFSDVGDYDYFSTDHHGTPYERACAFSEGYYYAKENNSTLATANTYGLQYVATDNPCVVRKYKAYLTQLQKNIEQYNYDVKMKNVGGLYINTKSSNKKYRIFITTADGKGANYYMNMKEVKYRTAAGKYSWEFPEAYKEYTIPNLSSNFNYQVTIFRKSWFWGEIKMYSFFLKPVKGKNHDLVFKNNSFSFSTPF